MTWGVETSWGHNGELIRGCFFKARKKSVIRNSECSERLTKRVCALIVIGYHLFGKSGNAGILRSDSQVRRRGTRRPAGGMPTLPGMGNSECPPRRVNFMRNILTSLHERYGSARKLTKRCFALIVIGSWGKGEITDDGAYELKILSLPMPRWQSGPRL